MAQAPRFQRSLIVLLVMVNVLLAAAVGFLVATWPGGLQVGG
jgi:hypothetical protein